METEEARGLYLEYKGLSDQLQKIRQYLERTQESMGEVNGLVESLDEFSRLEKGDRIFAPIANGIFVDATLNDVTRLRLNVGGGVVVEKSIAEAKGMLGRQRSELETLRDRADADAETVMRRMREIESLIEQESADKT